ncbi:MAG: hypothetical protein QOJ22_1113, partial [Thermoleophilaceae bacterium]|nr:hypothetical protein [Thermoleophilaceae bacterium]
MTGHDLPDERRSEADLRASERRYRTLVEQMPGVTYQCDFDDHAAIRYISPQIEAWTGRPSDEWLGDVRVWERLVHPADRERVAAEAARCRADRLPFDCKYRLVDADGRDLWVWDRDDIVLGDDGEPAYLQGIMVDVSPLHRAEAALRDSEQRMRAMVGAAPLVMAALAADGTITLATGKALEGLGPRGARLVGRSVFTVFHDLPEVLGDCRRALAGESVSTISEVDGRAFESVYAPVLDGDGELESVIMVATDVTERRRDVAKIAHLAYHDPLTDLPNRARFDEHLWRALAARRGGGPELAVLHLELDDLALITDGLGHETGEALIREVAVRLRAALPAGTLLARHGGEAFLVLLEQLGDAPPEEAEAVVTALQATVRAPVHVFGVELHVTMSAGFALCPRHGEDAGELLRDAVV